MLIHRRSFSFSLAMLAALPVAVASCGGKVFVDSTGGTGGTTGTSCAALLQDFNDKVLAASACAPQLAVVQCDGSATVEDLCGCPLLLNEGKPEAVQAAIEAANAAQAAGCAPTSCDTCMSGGEPECLFDADPTSGHCVWAFPL